MAFFTFHPFYFLMILFRVELLLIFAMTLVLAKYDYRNLELLYNIAQYVQVEALKLFIWNKLVFSPQKAGISGFMC